MGMGRKRKHRPDLPARVTFEHGAYYFRRASDHKRVHLGKDYAAAMKAWADLLETTPISQRLSAVMDGYLRSERFLKRKPRTREDYHDAIRRLRPVFGEMFPEDIEPKHIYGYMNRRGAPVRANREVAVLSNVLQLAIQLGYINKNPCREVRRNEENPRSREVSDEELAAFLPHCPEWLHAYLHLKMLTGLRQGDMLNLTVRSITEKGLFVATGKRGKRLLFTWTEHLRTAVDLVRGIQRPISSLYLFNSNRGTKLSDHGFKSAWSRAMRAAIKAKALAERFAENDLRAKVASDAQELGQDATAMLGHSSDAVTRRHYIRGTQKVEPLKKNIPK
jgi:integrase